MNAEQETVKFKYIFSDDYNPVYVNGAYGGVTARGEIVVNFYLERHALPYSVTHSLEQGGAVGEQVAREPEDSARTLVRFVTNGIVLSAEHAKSIHAWLGKHIEAAEKMVHATDALPKGGEEES